jgi:hypothetical protein
MMDAGFAANAYAFTWPGQGRPGFDDGRWTSEYEWDARTRSQSHHVEWMFTMPVATPPPSAHKSVVTTPRAATSPTAPAHPIPAATNTTSLGQP